MPKQYRIPTTPPADYTRASSILAAANGHLDRSNRVTWIMRLRVFMPTSCKSRK